MLGFWGLGFRVPLIKLSTLSPLALKPELVELKPGSGNRKSIWEFPKIGDPRVLLKGSLKGSKRVAKRFRV